MKRYIIEVAAEIEGDDEQDAYERLSDLLSKFESDHGHTFALIPDPYSIIPTDLKPTHDELGIHEEEA